MHTLNMLIIDDNPGDILSLKKTIQHSFPGIKIFESLSGKAGSDVIRENKIDLILLDVQTPGMNGFETAEQIKAGGANIPIIFVTGAEPDKKWISRMTEAGGIDYLIKPAEDDSYFIRFLDMYFRFMNREREIHRQLSEANRHLLREINERIQLEERLRQKQNRLTLINSISTRITSAMSVEQVVEHTVKEISRYFPDYRIAYSTVDPQGKITVIYSKEPEGMPELTGLTADLTIAPDYLHSLISQETVIINDVFHDPLVTPLIRAMEAGHTRALLDLPLIHSEQLVGLLCFDSSEPREWSDHEIATLTELTLYLSLIIKEARNREERRKTEEALRVGEERFRNLFELAPDAIFLADPETGEILDANHAASELMQMPRDKIIGRHQSELHPPQTEELAKLTFREHLEESEIKGMTSPTEIPVFREDGTIRNVEVLAQVIDLQNKPALMGIFRDIEIRKQAENALKKAKDAAEESNRAKSEFLATMGHEIRTPLNAILGFTDLLYPLIENEEHRSYFEAIKSGGNDLLMLINDILDLSRIEAGKMKFHYESVDLHILFDELQRIFSAGIAEKQIDFITDISSDISGCLLLDKARLRQILFNLIGNAVKFTKKGYVKLSAEIRTAAADRFNLVISVEDTGIGISPESQEEIFGTFRQQDSRSTRKYGGTGLGLAITKRLVEMMNGTVSVKSEISKGSLFEIVFCDVSATDTPFEPENEKASVTENIVFKKATILAADDSALNLKLLEAHFEDTDFQLIKARDGEEAASLAAQHKPDMILMDLRMPGMDGYEAMKLIKADETLEHIPVIALTSVLTDDIKEKVMQAGFDGYMEKPPQPSVLFETMARFIPSFKKEQTADKMPKPEDRYQAVIPPETVEKFPEIIEQLEGEFTELWHTARQSETFDEIEDFGRQVMAYGRRYSLTILEQFGEELMNYVSYFDIDNMRTTLNSYPERIETLKSARIM